MICCCCKRSYQQLRERRRKYDNAIEELEEEFDLINIIKSLRNSRLVSHMVLEKYQLRMIKYFKRNVLTSEQLDAAAIHKKDPPDSMDQECIDQMICDGLVTAP